MNVSVNVNDRKTHSERVKRATPWITSLTIILATTAPTTSTAQSDSEVIQHEGLPPVESDDSDDDESSDDSDADTTEQGDDQDDSASDDTSDISTSVSASYGATLAVDTAWQNQREDIVEWTARTDLRLSADFGDNWRAVVAGELHHWTAARQNSDGPTLLINGDDPRAALRADLRESYVQRRADTWTFRAGHLITNWGSTSLVQPSNVVNPSDLTDIAGATTGASSVRPQPAVEATWQRPNWSLQGVVVPFFVPNRVAVIGRDTAVANPNNPAVSDQFPIFDVLDGALDPSLYDEAQPLLSATAIPDERPKNASAGLRFSGTFANTDLGASYFFGWDRTPFLEVDEDVRELTRLVVADGQVLQDYDFQAFLGRNPEGFELIDSISQSAESGETLVSSTYRRRHTLGVDAARYFGPIGVRADVAFTPAKTFLTDDLASVRRPMIFGALGLSYERLTGSRTLAVNLEPFIMRPLPGDSAVTDAFVADGEQGQGADLLLTDDLLAGTALAVQWELPLWSLTADFAGYGTFTNRDVVASLGLTQQFSPALQTGLRGVLYAGPDPADDLSVGGLYDQNDQLLLTLTGNF